MAPDDILEQFELTHAALNFTCHPIGRLVVAMRIVSPTDKQGSGAHFGHAIHDGADRAFGVFAFMGNEAIGAPEEENLLWSQAQFRGRLSCLFLAE